MTDNQAKWWHRSLNALIVAVIVLGGVGLYKVYTSHKDCESRGGVRVQGACIDKAVLR